MSSDVIFKDDNFQGKDYELACLCMIQDWDRLRQVLPTATRQQLFWIDPGTGGTVLHAACLNNPPSDIVVELLSRGLDVDAVDRDGVTCLYVAVFLDASVELVMLLLENGADPNRANSFNGCVPLHIAARNNVKPGILQVLLQHGANPNITIQPSFMS
jgi:ankyrin repeat protein